MRSEGMTSEEKLKAIAALASPHSSSPHSSSGILQRMDPGRTAFQILFYRFWYWVLLLLFTFIYRARFYNTGAVPDVGGLLVISNHQSHLDPPLVGVAIRRRNMAAIARAGLFKVPVLGFWLRAVGCIAIKEDAGDAGALRAAIEQLKAGRLVVIFPEGSRSPDGAVHEFKRGVWLMMMRSGVPVLPAAVEGCFDAMPRGKTWPRVFGERVAVAFGTPISHAELKALGADAGLARLEREVEMLRMDLRGKLRVATRGRVPRAGAGDLVRVSG
jgi:1-acyl-sn-glycerol-3-phosphate acyltransferase